MRKVQGKQKKIGLASHLIRWTSVRHSVKHLTSDGHPADRCAFESVNSSSQDLPGLDEHRAQFQVVDQRVHGAFQRRLQQQIGFRKRRLRSGQQGGPVLEGPVQTQGNAAEDEAQDEQPEEIVAQERKIRVLCVKS